MDSSEIYIAKTGSALKTQSTMPAIYKWYMGGVCKLPKGVLSGLVV